MGGKESGPGTNQSISKVSGRRMVGADVVEGIDEVEEDGCPDAKADGSFSLGDTLDDGNIDGFVDGCWLGTVDGQTDGVEDGARDG